MNLPKKEKKLKKARSGAQNAELGNSVARSLSYGLLIRRE
jgi:hypothetical protein